MSKADRRINTDAALALHGQALTSSMRQLLVLCRALRRRKYEVTPEGVRMLEDLLFVHSCDLQEFTSLVAERLQDYGALAASVSAAVDGVDPFPVPPMAMPAGVLVCIGSYVPTPANDTTGGVRS